MKTIRINRKFLKEQNINAYISKALAGKLGVVWPLKKGWRKNLLGKEIKDFRDTGHAEEKFFEF